MGGEAIRILYSQSPPSSNKVQNVRSCNSTPPHVFMALCLLFVTFTFNPLNAELNPIYLLALLGAHHFLHVSRIRVKSLTFRLLMSYIYIYI